MRPGKIPKWLSGLVHPVSSYILCRNISDLNHLIIMHNICWRENLLSKDTAWEVFVFGVFLVRIFPHSDWIQRDTLFTLNAERCTFQAVIVILVLTIYGSFFSEKH